MNDTATPGDDATVTWYPRYYTVGDELLAVIHLSDGGRDRLVFDEAIGRLVHDPWPGAPGDLPSDAVEVSEAEHERLSSERRADLVALWARRLCWAASGSAEDLEEALGVPLEPTPIVASNVDVNAGDSPSVVFDLRPKTFSRGQLEAVLGGGRALPRHEADDPHVLAFDVESPGAPFRCIVAASLFDQPAPDADVRRVELRLDRAG